MPARKEPAREGTGSFLSCGGRRAMDRSLRAATNTVRDVRGLERPVEPAGRLSPAVPPRRILGEEVLVVLALSLLASAVFALIDLFSAPIAGVTRVLFRQDLELATHLASILFSLAPVGLVLHLVRRSGEGMRPIGLGTDLLIRDVGWGLLAGLAVGLAGLGLYVGAVALEVNRFIVPVPPLGHWWTIPVLVLGAVRAGLLEEIIVVGYLIRRLEQIGWGPAAAISASAGLRAGYHLYQGWGGFLGNLLLGVAFGYAFWRWRRTWPLVTAHALVDLLAGIGYVVFRGECFLGACLP
jgi:membrane protease YdiL (CAAX protease family)